MLYPDKRTYCGCSGFGDNRNSQSVLGHRYDGSDDSSFRLRISSCCHRLGTKKLLFAHMSLTSKSSNWIAALNEAANLQLPNGIREAIVIPELVSDHGCQPTSPAFFKACSGLGIQQIFASYSNPKGNADTERVIRTQKEDLVWPREFDSIADFEKAPTVWQKEYNEDYPHSSLGYMTPYEYERWFHASAA